MVTKAELPGEKLDMQKMPGHWALARLGKRVLRPGGLEMTQELLSALRIGPEDHVVEFAPGLGLTARKVLKAEPASYTAVERDEAAAKLVNGYLTGPNQRCVRGHAQDTGLETHSATVVYGEAMLTMQTTEQKRVIIREAARILKPGGRYGVHEICLMPDDLAEDEVRVLEADLALAIRSGVRPLRRCEWRELFESADLRVEREFTNDFHLLEPRRMLRDEGFFGAARILFNMLRDPVARSRVMTMRRAIRRHAHHMRAIMLIGVKR